MHGRPLELDIPAPKIEMGTDVVINNLWSILNNTTANIALTCCQFFLPADLHLEMFLPLAVCFMTTSQGWWTWWRNTRKTSASSTWTRIWDVFCDALAARFTNASQVLVCGDDADVFILLFHHAYRLFAVLIELDVSGRNSWRCINISELPRKIGPQVSEISLFAVLWFRMEQRLFISTVVPISIPGMSSSGYLPCVHWLWLYNTIQSEWREQAFVADDEWSGSSRCFYTSKWDGIATRFCPLQVENCTCMFINGGNLPLYVRFWRLCVKWSIVKQWYIFLWENAIGQFCTKFPYSKRYICPARDKPWNVPLQNRCHFPHFFIKMVQFYKVCSKIWIRFYKYSWQSMDM